MQAVILAGGAGTRLRPVTTNVPKPMIEVNGKPFLQYVIEELKKYGINNFVLCIGYLADKFKEYFGDGTKFGIKVSYSVEKEFMGTGGAIKLAQGHLEDNFFVVNGDTFLAINYAEAYDKFIKSGKKALMVLYDNNEHIAEPNIAIDRKGDVIGYFKKETLKRGDEEVSRGREEKFNFSYIDAGVQIYKRNVLDFIQSGKFASLEVDVFPKLIANRDMTAYVTAQRYYDLGTPERLEVIRKVLR